MARRGAGPRTTADARGGRASNKRDVMLCAHSIEGKARRETGRACPNKLSSERSELIFVFTVDVVRQDGWDCSQPPELPQGS